MKQKLLLHNTPQGLKPCYDSDYEEKKKIKLGAKVWANVWEARNPKNHKRFFAMINCAWFHLHENKRREFRDEQHFRYQLMIESGHADIIVKPVEGDVYKIAHSIAFDKMDETEFRGVFKDVLDVIFRKYVSIQRKDFFNEMMNFM